MIRRLLVASAALVVAGAAGTLALLAAHSTRWDTGATVLLALAAMWIPQVLRGFSRRYDRPSKCQHIYGTRTVQHSYIRRHRAI